MPLLQRIVYLAFVFLLLPAAVCADTITLGSSRDSTMYQGNPSNSNGAGRALFAGTTGQGTSCRGLIGFDIASKVPTGSIITGVQLGLILAQTSPNEVARRQIQLCRLLADWGEGSAGAGSSNGGQGFPTPSDGTAATWTHRFLDTTPWANAGGDFTPVASASTMVGTMPIDLYVWDSTPALVSDVQSWLDNPASNFGWLVMGDESSPATARLFFTREAADSTTWPALRVTFTPPVLGATRFVVSASSGVIAGSSVDVTVTALDNAGNIATGYTGTVSFSSSDPYPGVLPGDYTFTSADNGTHTFAGVTTLFTAGAQTFTVRDVADASISGSATIAVTAAPASQLLVTALTNVVPGTPFDVLVTALDPYGNVDTNYAGTVTWVSSDPEPGVSLPTDHTFQATDGGIHLFSGAVTLITVGEQVLTVTDTESGITGSATVTVGPSP